MAEKVKLNKNSLREQTQSLKLFQEFLPTLELRKQQLQMEVREAQHEIRAAEKELQEMLSSSGDWVSAMAPHMELLRQLLVVSEVKVRHVNVAGVRVPQFEEVVFERRPYSILGTPWLIDAAMDFLRRMISARKKVDVLREKFELLDRELTKTTQRINLYEKVLIPQTKENIRKIKIYLGDQQIAAVARAKIAKAKLVAKAEQQVAEEED